MAKKQVKPSRRELKGFDEVAREAVFEAEFLALVVEHPHTPNHILGSIRFAMIGALSKLSDAIQEGRWDGQLVRDIYPHALCVEPAFLDVFRLILGGVEQDAPRVLQSIQNHADRGAEPPRYPHPLKELFAEYRMRFGLQREEAKQ